MSFETIYITKNWIILNKILYDLMYEIRLKHIISYSWSNALRIELNKNKVTDNNWIFSFKLKSLAPWWFSERFFIQMIWWWDNYIQNNW